MTEPHVLVRLSMTEPLAAVLALAAAEPAVAGRTALVTATDRDGTVGAALLRLAGAA